MKEHYEIINGNEYHILSSGVGSPIVFLHGFPELGYAWKEQINFFAKHNLAAAPDLLGYNLTSKPSDAYHYKLAYMVKDIKAILVSIIILARELSPDIKPRPVILVGHDWGGLIAWILTSKYPALVGKLIIINTPHPLLFDREWKNNPAQKEKSAYIETLLRPGAEKLLARSNFDILRMSIPGFDDFSVEVREKYINSWSQPDSLTGMLNYYRANQPGRLSHTINKNTEINVPTLVIWGENEQYFVPETLNGLEDLVPKLQIKRIKNASHWIIHERPDIINQLVKQFISD